MTTPTESSTIDPSTTIADSSGESTTGLVCNDVVVEGVPFESHPIDLFVLAMPGANPASFNAAFTSEDFAAFAAATDMRTVVIDPMVGVAAPAEACAACSSGTCATAVRVEIPENESPFPTLFDPDPYTCVLHPIEDEPRRRLLLLSPSSVLDFETAAAMENLISDDLWDVDMACPDCSSEAPGFTQTVAAAGGVVADLDSDDIMTFALYSAAVRPPHCGWPITDPIEPPLDLSDLSITVDFCPDAPCPLEIEQVTGIGTCDADDPSTNEFFILEDAIEEGTSLALLCAPACEDLRRVYAEEFSVTHSYRCPT